MFDISIMSDTQHERNILLERIYTRLRAVASANNVEVTFVDMVNKDNYCTRLVLNASCSGSVYEMKTP